MGCVMKIKNLLFFLLSLLAGIGLFYWIIGLIGWQDIKRAFLIFVGWQGLVILGLTLIIMVIENQRWKDVLNAQEVTLSFKRLWRIFLASFSLRYFVPGALFGGEMFRGYLLNKKHSIGWPKAIASVTIDRILSWTANLVVIFLGIFFFMFNPRVAEALRNGSAQEFSVKNLGIVFASTFIVFAGAMTLFYFKSFREESIFKFFFIFLSSKKKGSRGFLANSKEKILKIEQELFNFFKPNKAAMWRGLGFSFLRTGFMLLRTWLLAVFLSKIIGFLSATSLLAFSLLTAMVPVPAQLGVHEAAQAFAFSALGLGAGTGTAFAMFLRATELLIVLFGFIVLAKLGLELFKNRILEKVGKTIIKV